jgi:hypothetical protein
VFYDVYRMRALGTEMSTDWVLERGPVRGRLTIATGGRERRPRDVAELFGENGRHVLPPLDYATREEVPGKPGVVVVTGWEDSTQNPKSSRCTTHQQQWVCVEVPAP